MGRLGVDVGLPRRLAQSAHRGTGPRNTAISHSTAATAYTPRITAYSWGSQWSTSQIHTSTAIRPISGSLSTADTRTGSVASWSMNG